jgi:3,4-dihydroxy 2-butanone 4-phosphate synthase/GTP cyclohydrolase II
MKDAPVHPPRSRSARPSAAGIEALERFEAALSPPEEIIAAAREGRMVILVDKEDRENEGDLVLAAEFATPAAINFMAKHARGLICLAMTKSRVAELGLPLMSPDNGTRHQTAFTVSIEAREGVTTGISAADRARTIQVAIDPAKGKSDIVTPGHIFPLVAREGGVLERAGHTEAAVDIARLAGLNPAGVICEVMNEDGSMARLPELVAFAQLHGIKVGAIADLIAYRRRTESLIECVHESPFATAASGDWTLRIYVTKIEGAEQVVLIKGKIEPDRPTLVRMHVLSFLDDVLERAGDRAGQLRACMDAIDKEGAGVIVIFRGSRPASLREALERSAPPPAPTSDTVLRDYGVGAQILLDLGVRDLILLTSSPRHTLVGLEGFGLNIVEERGIPPLGG